MKVLAKDKTTGPRIKPRIPWTLNPGAKNAANVKHTPFTIRENAPKLRKLSGKDKVDRIGLTEPLIKPITKAAIKAAGKLAILTPGTIKSTISRLKAVASVIKKVPNNIFFHLRTKDCFNVLKLSSTKCLGLNLPKKVDLFYAIWLVCEKKLSKSVELKLDITPSISNVGCVRHITM
jgi:hypothetical protein